MTALKTTTVTGSNIIQATAISNLQQASANNKYHTAMTSQFQEPSAFISTVYLDQPEQVQLLHTDTAYSFQTAVVHADGHIKYIYIDTPCSMLYVSALDLNQLLEAISTDDCPDRETLAECYYMQSSSLDYAASAYRDCITACMQQYIIHLTTAEMTEYSNLNK